MIGVTKIQEPFPYLTPFEFHQLGDKKYIVLFDACEKKELDKVRYYLQYASPNVPISFRERKTPLHIAIKCESLKIVRLLLQNRANPNLLDQYEHSPLWYAAGITKAKLSNRIGKELIKYGAKTNMGSSPLARALKRNKKALVATLLESKAEVNAILKTEKEQPLVLALKNEQWENAKTILELGADPNSYLAFFVEKGNREAVQILLEGKGDPNYVESFWSTTLLQKAAERGHRSVVELLIENKADIEKSVSLIKVARSGEVETTKILLERGADVNQANRKGVTALYEALSGRHFTLAKLLLDQKADVHAKDNRGRSILERIKAKHPHNKNAISFLINHDKKLICDS